MPTPKQSWIEFLIEGVIGWIWIAVSLVAVYFLISAVFFDGGRWRAVASVAAAWFLYGHAVLPASKDRSVMTSMCGECLFGRRGLD